MPQEYGAYVYGMAEVEEVAGGGVWTRIWQAFLSSLDEQSKLLWSRAFLDGSFFQRKKGGEEVGLTEVGKGTKRMLVVDGNGVPFHLPGQQGRGGASPGDFGTGAGTAGEGASEEEAGKACGEQGVQL